MTIDNHEVTSETGRQLGRPSEPTRAMISRILAPVVFSERCAWAARYASRLADTFAAELVFVHVGEDSDQRLTTFLTSVIGEGRYHSLTVQGDAADRIVETAKERGSDLIVMPTYSRGTFRRLLLGSVTAKVLHDVDCPVLTGVHHDRDPMIVPDKIRHIVAAVDRGPGCLQVIQWATDLAKQLNASLKIVHAVPAADETSDNHGEIAVRRSLIQEATDAFDRDLAEQHLTSPVQIAGGDVVRVVREAVLTEHADLVVIGRSCTDRFLGRLRTHTYEIVWKSPCPVVSI